MSVVQTRSGAVRGAAFDEVRVWRGLPYAAPPVGELRWAAPHREPPWDGVRDAHDFGPRAPQREPELMPALELDVPTDAHTPYSEDCLYLNVCAPAGYPESGADKLPVQLWLHGGGFHYGSGANPFGEGAGVARHGTVVVTVNYRLGALGFLNLGALLGPEYAAAANAGLLDQIAALRWVRDNIAAFGGDPGNVTVAGLSAGGKSLMNLMAAPAAKGLFHKGISHSGGDHTAAPATTAALAARFVGLLDLPGGDIGRIREVPVDDILAAQYALGSGPRAIWIWRATVDGGTLPLRPTHALAAGHAAGIPLVAGSTDNEAGVYVKADPTVDDFADEVLASAFAERSASVVRAYADTYPELTDAQRRHVFMTDERYGAPTLRLLDAQSRYAPVWGFRFRAPTEGQPAEDWYFHGSDVPYAFGLAASRDQAVDRVCRGMQQALAGFRSTAVPYSPLLPDWPNYERVGRATMLFDNPPRVLPDGANPLYPAVWADHDWTPGTWWPLLDSRG
jgi:para-nitrobenzyl esterase